MKYSMLASLLLAAFAWSAQADETDAGAAVSADRPAGQSVEAQSQTGMDLASHSLKAVSAHIGADLEARLERAVGNQDGLGHKPQKLLVSTH